MNFTAIIPTYNPGYVWLKCVEALNSHVIKPDQALIIDSGSQDGSVSIPIDAGFQVKSIKR